ncbi:2Fe-2S iron-sulfur cluster binding domain-containing protein [Pedobacter changchengzhani]|uniref:2Fe-2S iron-sulfur cluster binding domain-containing protein n=1 Tax=Pedobacter changchengzhani TaxID=2529274 RepID=A0A4R5MK37_9SPHI|nr:2Fe-2S iron-sulfur cluster-binding protein [Pedobacter changchengzhani]TDG35902.1 2Fe-2S iron-sulfur cluster binding domain-containing protein [Pedobacter changchengzhani]
MKRTDVVKIKIDYEGFLHEVETFPNEYRSLMALIFDRISPDDFGDCLGMGKCATCLVQIKNQHHPLTTFDRNEQTTLKKHGILEDGFRLSCQLQIDENLNNLQVEIIRP